MWIRNGVLETIENQHNFEIAVAHLYNETNEGWELFFMFLPDQNEDDESEGGVGLVEDELGEITLTFEPPDMTQEKGKGKEGAFKSGGIAELAYTVAATSTHRDKGKGREMDYGYEKVQQLPYMEADVSSSEGKENEKASEYEQLKPAIYSQPGAPSLNQEFGWVNLEAEWSRGGTRTKDNEQGTSQTAAPVSHQAPERPQATEGVGQRSTDYMGDSMEDAVSRILALRNDVEQAEQARKRAQQRVNEVKKKERAKEAEAQAQKGLGRGAVRAARNVTSPNTAKYSSKQSIPASSSQTRRNPSVRIQRSTLPTETRQSASPSTPLSPNTDRTVQNRASNMTFMSTSSEALPYQLTDRERQEKILKVRSQFPIREAPNWAETEKALLEAHGIVDKAIAKLGGTLNKSKITVPPKPPLSRPSRSVTTPKSTRNVELTETSIVNVSRGEASSSRTPPAAKKIPATTNTPATMRSPASMRTLATMNAPAIIKAAVTKHGKESGSKKSTAPGVGLLAPPPTDPKDKSTKLSLPQRLQKAGRQLSLSTGGVSKRETGKSGNVPKTPLTAGLRSVLGALNPRGPLVSPGAGDKSYEFSVTKEIAYKSGGSEEGAFDALDEYREPDTDVELGENVKSKGDVESKEDGEWGADVNLDCEDGEVKNKGQDVTEM